MPDVSGVRRVYGVRLMARVPAPLLVRCPWCGAPRLEGCEVPPPPPGPRPIAASVHAERVRAAAEALERGELEPPGPDERVRMGRAKVRGLGVLAAAAMGAALFPDLARVLLEARPPPNPRPAPEPWPEPSAYMAEPLEGGRWWWWCADCDARGESGESEAHHRCGAGEVLELRRIRRPAPRRGEVLEAEVLEAEVLEVPRLLEPPEVCPSRLEAHAPRERFPTCQRSGLTLGDGARVSGWCPATGERCRARCGGRSW